MTEDTSAILENHLLKSDGQEDACFCLWNKSEGQKRYTGILKLPIIPTEEQRTVRGSVQIFDDFFLETLRIAKEKNMGIALLHSHPFGRGWQELSNNDKIAERYYSSRVLAVTGFPLIGLTLSGDRIWSARYWIRIGKRVFKAIETENVRLVGPNFKVNFNEKIKPAPDVSDSQIRTVSAWGEKVQADLSRLRIGIVGAGSVGTIVGEAVSRMGVQELHIIDYDTIETLNLDRLLFTSKRDVGKSKVNNLKKVITRSHTSKKFLCKILKESVATEEAIRDLIDCDIIFSCVDRHLARSVLNYIAYVHLIPVIDGGVLINVSNDNQMKSGTVGALVSMPGRICLECSGQYDSGLVSVDRDGYLDKLEYIEGLPKNDVLAKRENVIVFSLAASSFELLQLISMIVRPKGIGTLGNLSYDVATGTLDQDFKGCNSMCFYPKIVGKGDNYNTRPF